MKRPCVDAYLRAEARGDKALAERLVRDMEALPTRWDNARAPRSADAPDRRPVAPVERTGRLHPDAFGHRIAAARTVREDGERVEIADGVWSRPTQHMVIPARCSRCHKLLSDTPAMRAPCLGRPVQEATAASALAVSLEVNGSVDGDVVHVVYGPEREPLLATERALIAPPTARPAMRHSEPDKAPAGPKRRLNLYDEREARSTVHGASRPRRVF